MGRGGEGVVWGGKCIIIRLPRPMLMEFMFQMKIFQNIDEGGRSSCTSKEA